MQVETKTLTNGEIESALPLLDELRKRTDEIGYAAAWNYRRLNETISDYIQDKARILDNEGVKHDDGTYSLLFGSQALDELMHLINMQRNVDVCTLSADDAFGNVSGEAIITLDFMFSGAWGVRLE